ncbi:MAG: hypothetical protein DMF61_05020 [Blastocatellia bacterium AA13]|nr:MAG: hypothetical protein DMF61_05020 [Blastocatellia bacterium AA13]
MRPAITRMASGRDTLEAKISERIRRDGPIRFRDFMEIALYDAESGYYNTRRNKIGPAGDYYTSGNVHEAFGATLAVAFAGMWSHEYAEPLTILEFGAGTGQLAFDIISTMKLERPDIFVELNYLILERSTAMQESQRRLLEPVDQKVNWVPFEPASNADPFQGIVFSNELIDAMPAHLARIHEGRVQEGYVDLTATGATGATGDSRLERSISAAFAICWEEPSDRAIESYISDLGVDLAEGQMLEVNLDAIAWLERVSRILNRGFLVTIDYGDIAAHLYGRDRFGGTLRSFSRHRIAESPLLKVGEQDITSSVNFSALIEQGRQLGFEMVSYERQSSFLIRNGLLERAAGLCESGDNRPDTLSNRLAIKNLLVEGGSSDNFRVLVQRKGVVRRPTESS